MMGFSLNVILSEEQIKNIAKLTAKEVSLDRDWYINENERLREEIDGLHKKLKEKDELIIRQAVRNDMLYERIKKKNQIIEELKNNH